MKKRRVEPAGFLGGGACKARRQRRQPGGTGKVRRRRRQQQQHVCQTGGAFAGGWLAVKDKSSCIGGAEVWLMPGRFGATTSGNSRCSRFQWPQQQVECFNIVAGMGQACDVHRPFITSTAHLQRLAGWLAARLG